MNRYGPTEQGEPRTFDPIDVQLQQSGATAGRLSPKSRFGALDWSTGGFPALLLLLSGAALGPHGLALLTPQAIALLDPATPVALAALGVVAGLSVRTGREHRWVVAASSTQAMATAILVAAGVLVAGPAVMTLSPFPPWWMVALALGVSAATSSSVPPDPTRTSHDVAMRLDVQDYLLPIVMGGVLLAFFRDPSPAAALLLAAQATLIAIVIAIAGWLLLSQAATPAEQRVCVFASLLLLGGAADYLSTSAMLGGLVAGACWQFAGSAVREYIRRDVTYVQHSLLVLILLLAGARADLSPAALTLSIAYVVVRTSVKLLGGWLATRVSAVIPRDTDVQLISPGVFGVAFASNVVRADGAEFVPVLTVVVVGSIASSLIAAFARSGASKA
jgi:hypothetical protein